MYINNFKYELKDNKYLINGKLNIPDINRFKFLKSILSKIDNYLKYNYIDAVISDENKTKLVMLLNWVHYDYYKNRKNDRELEYKTLEYFDYNSHIIDDIIDHVIDIEFLNRDLIYYIKGEL